jgi:tetratricopeptide (TPR) repeat protein
MSSQRSPSETAAKKRLQDALDSHPLDLPLVSEATWELASMYAHTGNFRDARDLLEPALETWGQSSDVSQWVLANLQVLLASVLSHLGDHAGAILLVRSAVEVFERENPGDDRFRWALERLAIDLKELGRLDEALGVQREIIDWLCRFEGDNDAETIRASARAAGTLQEVGRVTEARDAFLELLDKARETQDVRLVVDLKRNVVKTLMAIGDWSDAAAMTCELVQEASELLGPNDEYGQFARRWRKTIQYVLDPSAQGSARLRETRAVQRLIAAAVK